MFWYHTRQLDRQISTLYYERLLASRDKAPVIQEAADKLDKQTLLVKRFWVYAILSHIDFKQLASFRFQFNLSIAIAFAQYGQQFSLGIEVIQIQGNNRDVYDIML
jgi:hypothetical protein